MTCSISNAQFIKEIYKSEIRAESPDIGTYNINVLILNNDGTFELQWQTYATKKMAKRHVILNLITRMGKWEKKGDFLIIDSAENGQDFKFLIKTKNRIVKVIDDSGAISLLEWKKVIH